MLFFILISVSLSRSAYAIDYLPCQRALKGSAFVAPDGQTYNLNNHQVVMDGSFETFQDQGSGTSFSVRDRQVDHRLSDGVAAYPYPVVVGAPVFFRHGGELLAGRHSLVYENQMSRPRLLAADTNLPLLNDQEYMKAFFKRQNVLVINRLDRRSIAELDEQMIAKQARLSAFARDAHRFVDIGNGTFYECDSGESAFAAEVEHDADNRSVLKFVGPRPDLSARSKVYLIDAQNVRVGSLSYGAFLDPIGEFETTLIAQANRAVVIRRDGP